MIVVDDVDEDSDKVYREINKWVMHEERWSSSNVELELMLPFDDDSNREIKPKETQWLNSSRMSTSNIWKSTERPTKWKGEFSRWAACKRPERRESKYRASFSLRHHSARRREWRWAAKSSSSARSNWSCRTNVVSEWLTKRDSIGSMNGAKRTTDSCRKPFQFGFDAAVRPIGSCEFPLELQSDPVSPSKHNPIIPLIFRSHTNRNESERHLSHLIRTAIHRFVDLEREDESKVARGHCYLYQMENIRR